MGLFDRFKKTVAHLYDKTIVKGSGDLFAATSSSNGQGNHAGEGSDGRNLVKKTEAKIKNPTPNDKAGFVFGSGESTTGYKNSTEKIQSELDEQKKQLFLKLEKKLPDELGYIKYLNKFKASLDLNKPDDKHTLPQPTGAALSFKEGFPKSKGGVINDESENKGRTKFLDSIDDKPMSRNDLELAVDFIIDFKDEQHVDLDTKLIDEQDKDLVSRHVEFDRPNKIDWSYRESNEVLQSIDVYRLSDGSEHEAAIDSGLPYVETDDKSPARDDRSRDSSCSSLFEI